MAPNLDPAAVAKYGRAGALRRAFRQALGITDVRKASPQTIAGLRQQDPNRMTFDLLPLHRQQLAKRAVTRTKPAGAGGPAGGRPITGPGSAPASGGKAFGLMGPADVKTPVPATGAKPPVKLPGRPRVASQRRRGPQPAGGRLY